MLTNFAVRMAGAIVIVIMLFTIFPGKPTTAGAADGLKGWEVGSAYNTLYDPQERDSLKGKVVRFLEVTPLPGMDPGTAFILQESGDDAIVVHLCPEAFASAKETGIRIGDTVKVKGSWIEIDGEDIYVAAKVKKGDHFAFKVRLTSDGTPFWTMSPEQLKAEKNKE